MNKKSRSENTDSPTKESFPENVEYPSNEDIYNKEEKISIDEEGIPETKEKDKKDNETRKNLDVPGSELDDKNEEIGEEDEENNYYSLGGDNHNDLEEDKGE